MHSKLSFALLLLSFLPIASAGDLSIHLSDYKLQPNQANQSFPIFVHSLAGGEQVQGLQFRMQIGDGGVELGGHDIVPKISGSIVAPGTLFATNNTGEFGEILGGYFDFGTTTAHDLIPLPAGDSKWP